VAVEGVGGTARKSELPRSGGKVNDGFRLDLCDRFGADGGTRPASSEPEAEKAEKRLLTYCRRWT